MAAVPRLTRDEAVAEFWSDVRELLLGHYSRNSAQADLGINQYRADTQRLELGDTIYNQGVEQTAAVVDGIIEFGLPVPSPMPVSCQQSAGRN